ncbi:MAG: transporter substrate-binding domain-containing protein [Coriobacteriaceae bacterium]|nr:transporter substrate-binding domain-containing protein [Coriobacteriaceae bacterium]
MADRAIRSLLFALLAMMAVAAVALAPALAHADDLTPEYQTLDEMSGKRFAYVNGSVYNQRIQERLEGTSEDFYPSLSECVAAVEAGKADGAVQLSYCCQLAVNRRPGTVVLLPEPVADVSEGFFFPKGSKLTGQFNAVIKRFSEDGTLAKLEEKWVAADESGKTLPEQDWDAPNGTLKFATSGVIEPFSYVGEGGQPKGYDVELALLIARELGYHLEVTTIPMDSIFASVDTGKADFGGTLTNTPERAAICDFSEPVMPTTISVIVKSKEASSPTGFLEVMSNSFQKTFIDDNRWMLVLSGLGTTILISVCAGAFGLLLGYGIVLARRSRVRWVGKVVDCFQALISRIPIVVVLMLLYYVVFGSIDIAGEIVAIIAFTLAFGATVGSTMWTAIEGVDVIQEETGLALGYTRWQVFSKIIFPQARQQFTPQLMGQFVSLVKDTAIVGYISVLDLTRASDLIRARTMDAFFPLISTAVIYFLFCLLLSWVLHRIAARIDVTNRPRKIEGVDER